MTTEQSVALSRREYFWTSLALLAAGIGGHAASHSVASWSAGSRGAEFATAVLAGLSFAAVVRATSVMLVGGFSDAYRVFRSRHLFSCAALLGSSAVVLGTSVVHTPFARVLAHGQITGEDLADLGSVSAAFVCTVGSVIAAVSAGEALFDERHWYRTSHRGHRPR